MWAEFKKFISRGNVFDLAVGVVMGAAFGAIVKSLVDDVIMPPVGVLVGNVDFRDLFVILKEGTTPGPYETLVQAQQAGAVLLRYGLFLNAVISFLIVSAAVFALVRTINRLMPPAPAPASHTRACPWCTRAIPEKARRCPECTSQLD